MVMFWIVAVMLSLGVAAVIVKPLLKSAKLHSADANPDISIYRNQLKELERDVAMGSIGKDEAQTARVEISRRLLAASDEEPPLSSTLSARQRIGLILLVCLIMPSAAALIYLQDGRPSYSSRPYTDSNGEAEMWLQYGRAYMQSNQFEDAEDAFMQAIELSAPRADLYEALGEAIILAGDGTIPRRALEAFETALDLNPTRERSRYIIAEWTYRNGDREAGVRGFIDVLEDTKDEAVQVFLKERIDDAIAEIKAELAGDPAAQRTESEQEGALAGLSEDQRAQIRQMVERLAARLESEPDDLEAWLRLIRSYTVLQETDRAQEALQKAMLNFLSDRQAVERILALAEELELAKGPELPPGAEDVVLP